MTSHHLEKMSLTARPVQEITDMMHHILKMVGREGPIEREITWIDLIGKMKRTWRLFQAMGIAIDDMRTKMFHSLAMMNGTQKQIPAESHIKVEKAMIIIMATFQKTGLGSPEWTIKRVGGCKSRCTRHSMKQDPAWMKGSGRAEACRIQRKEENVSRMWMKGVDLMRWKAITKEKGTTQLKMMCLQKRKGRADSLMPHH